MGIHSFLLRTGTKIDDSTTCSAEGCPGTELKNLNTYFSEYVLEDSNASNYFNVYVAGFLFAPEVRMTLNLTTNSTNSSTDWRSPGNKDEKTVTTVWYSNEVKPCNNYWRKLSGNDIIICVPEGLQTPSTIFLALSPLFPLQAGHTCLKATKHGLLSDSDGMTYIGSLPGEKNGNLHNLGLGK